MDKVVSMLKEAALAVAAHWKEYHSPNQIVILGRDGWPLVPLLQQMGLPASYFLFSRLQIGDRGTKEQWLREVMPHALVVDTGYKGSIFGAILQFDPTISGVLLCSSGEYPQVDTPFNHCEVVKEIEKLPKIVGRGVAIDHRGYVRCPQDTRDGDENLAGLSPAQVVKLNKELCLALGIDLHWASFTGITPKSRIPWELGRWYKDVAAARLESQPGLVDLVQEMCTESDEDGMTVILDKEEYGFKQAVPLPFVYGRLYRRRRGPFCWHVVEDMPELGYARAVRIPYVREVWGGVTNLVVVEDYSAFGFAVAEDIIDCEDYEEDPDLVDF